MKKLSYLLKSRGETIVDFRKIIRNETSVVNDCCKCTFSFTSPETLERSDRFSNVNHRSKPIDGIS